MPESERSAADEPFATKLRRLFASVKREDGREHAKPEVAEAIGVSRGYIYDLLNGKSEPSHALVVKLARFFEVDLEYFADSEKGRALNRQYETLACLGENNVRQIAQRAAGLSEEQLRNVLAFIDFQASRSEDGPRT